MGKPVSSPFAVCSDCGLSWDDHEDKTSWASGDPYAPPSECIRLLNSKVHLLAKQNGIPF